MKEHTVVFAPEARQDLIELYDWIAAAADPATAYRYIERIQAFCRRLSTGSERGHLRNDIRPGLRIVGFEQRITVAFVVEDDHVAVLRLFCGGRDWESAFA